MAKSPQPRMEINLEEIYRILDCGAAATHERGQLREGQNRGGSAGGKSGPPVARYGKKRCRTPRSEPGKARRERSGVEGQAGQAGTRAQPRLDVHWRPPGQRDARHAPVWRHVPGMPE